MEKTVVAVILKGVVHTELAFAMLPLPVCKMVVHWRRTSGAKSLILCLNVSHFTDDEVLKLLGG